MSLCRACGQDHTLNGAPFGSFQDHARIYFDLTAIQLHEHEDPNVLELCSDCVDKLNEFDRFRDICLQVHYGLQVKNELQLDQPDVLKQEAEDNRQSNSTDEEEILGGEEPHELPFTSVMFVPSEDPVKSEFLSEEEDTGTISSARKRKRVKQDDKKLSQKASNYSCDQCPEVFQDQLLMVAHRRVHAGLTPFFCETCEQAFATLLEMKLHHAEQHTQQKTWDCDHPDCKEQFATHQALRQHKIKIHDPNYTKPKPRVSICEACGDTFENSQKLRRHKFAVHEPEEKPYMCEICFLRFSLPHKLKKHMLRHEGIRNHVCPYCGVAKITKGELTSHIKNIHSKESGLVNDAYHAAFSNHHMDVATTSAEDATKSEARPKKEKEWQRNVRKINRNNGKAYVRKDNVVVEGKSFQEQYDCGCPRKCRDKFESEAMLEQFFGSFWNLGDWHKQNALVADQVKGVDVNRHRPRSEDHPRSERTLQFQYFIPSRQDNVRVCQKYFLGILQISAGRLYKCLGRKTPNKKSK